MSEVVDVHDEAEQEWPGISARSITESGRTHMVYSFDLHPGNRTLLFSSSAHGEDVCVK